MRFICVAKFRKGQNVVCGDILTKTGYLCNNLYNDMVWRALCLLKRKICASFARGNF